MGTLSALIAALSAIAVVMAPLGIHWIALIIGFIALFLAARIGARPGFFLTAAALMSICIPLDDAFQLSRSEVRKLGKVAEDGDQTATMVMSVTETTANISGLLTLLGVALVAIAIAIAARAARRRRFDDGWHFVMSESDAIASLTVWIGKATSFLYVPMIIVIMYDVAQRKFLDFVPSFAESDWYHTFTSTKLQEAEWHMHAVLFLLCFGYAYIKDAHVRIELVRDRMAPRTRVWIELLGCTFFLTAYCYVVMRYGYDFSQKSYQLMEQSAAQTGLQMRFIIKAFLPFGFLVLALAAVSVAVKCLVYLFGPESLRAASSYYAGTHHADMREDTVKPVSLEN